MLGKNEVSEDTRGWNRERESRELERERRKDIETKGVGECVRMSECV